MKQSMGQLYIAYKTGNSVTFRPSSVLLLCLYIFWLIFVIFLPYFHLFSTVQNLRPLKPVALTAQSTYALFMGWAQTQVYIIPGYSSWWSFCHLYMGASLLYPVLDIVNIILRKGNGLMPGLRSERNKTHGLCTCPRMTKSRFRCLSCEGKSQTFHPFCFQNSQAQFYV